MIDDFPANGKQQVGSPVFKIQLIAMAIDEVEYWKKIIVNRINWNFQPISNPM